MSTIHEYTILNVESRRKLKTFRQMHKISQKELANVLCTTQQQISLYETGRRKLDEDQIAEICKVYKINPEEILENTKGESYMTKAQEIVLKIGEYIQEKDGKITFSEILEEYTKLPAPERTMVELMVEEHNKRYK